MQQLKVCLVKSSREEIFYLTPQHRAKIAKYSSECGNTAAVRNFSK